MKLLKFISFIALLLVCSYASLWYGFIKGVNYNFNSRIVSAEGTRSVLVSLRNGKTNEAIELLELQMGGDILSAYYSDESFVKYIIGLPAPSLNSKEVFSKRIQSYMQQYPYICHPDKEVCAAIGEAINNMAGTPSNKSLKDAP